MLDLHTGQNGYTEMVLPSLVNDAAMYGTDNLLQIRRRSIPHHRWMRWLILTAEDFADLPPSWARSRRKRTADPHHCTDRLFPHGGRGGGRDTRGMLPCTNVPQGGTGFDARIPITARRNTNSMTSSAEAVLPAAWRARSAASCSARAIPGLAPPRPMTWKCGCRASRRGGRSVPAPTRAGFPGAADECAVPFGGRQDRRAVSTLNGSRVAVGRALIAVMEKLPAG